LKVADEMGAVQDLEKSELSSLERAPSSLVADHAQPPKKMPPISGTNQFRRHSGSHRLRATFMNRSANIWPKRETLSSAIRAFSKDLTSQLVVEVPDGSLPLSPKSRNLLFQGIQVSQSSAGLAA
jgi:hypothetical protein